MFFDHLIGDSLEAQGSVADSVRVDEDLDHGVSTEGLGHAAAAAGGAGAGDVGRRGALQGAHGSVVTLRTWTRSRTFRGGEL